jgi:hypothetical protein
VAYHAAKVEYEKLQAELMALEGAFEESRRAAREAKAGVQDKLKEVELARASRVVDEVGGFFAICSCLTRLHRYAARATSEAYGALWKEDLECMSRCKRDSYHSIYKFWLRYPESLAVESRVEAKEFKDIPYSRQRLTSTSKIGGRDSTVETEKQQTRACSRWTRRRKTGTLNQGIEPAA